jgi:hypothetical protein
VEIRTDGWRTEPGNLDDWNNKRKSKFAIVPTGGTDEGGTHFDGPRVARSKAGKTVAMECESLNTFCLISPEADSKS